MNKEFAELDVRAILKNGGEPFQAIMGAVEALAPGQYLRLLAPFRPVPLYTVMAERGFDHEVYEMPDGHFAIHFIPKELTGIHSSEDAESPDVWPDPVVDLDLTDLEPPEPMVRLLSMTEKRQPGEVIFALLAREPLLLLPELTRRGHQWVGNFDEKGTAYRMMIRVGKAS